MQKLKSATRFAYCLIWAETPPGLSLYLQGFAVFTAAMASGTEKQVGDQNGTHFP